MNTLSNLFVLVLAAACNAFTIQTSSSRNVALNAFLDGKAFDPKNSFFSRGGKNSWEFERDTMYVEDPKKKIVPVKKAAAPVKKIVAKAAPVKKIVAKAVPVKKVVAANKAVANKKIVAPVKKAVVAAKKAVTPAKKNIFGF
jgi:hypothetical protein